MRWVLLTDDAPPRVGGVATFVARISAGLARRGHQVTVFRRHRPRWDPPPGVVVHSAWGPSFSRLAGRWLAVRAAPTLCRADAVIAATWICGTTVAHSRIPLYLIGHGSDVTRPGPRPEAFGRTWRAAAGRFALSGYLAQILGARGIDARVLPAPVTAAGAPRPPRSPRGRWGFVARAVPDKGGDRFIRLVAAAGVRGVIVGDGPALASWRSLAGRLGADVTFTGHVPAAAVPAILEGLDLVCLLPRTGIDGAGEGLGLALLEAAAVGVPVVGCATGGVPEAVGPGLILEDPDDADGSTQAIARWWTADRGVAAWEWLRDHHGTHRTIDALEQAAANSEGYSRDG